jgi:hypothetical protein
MATETGSDKPVEVHGSDILNTYVDLGKYDVKKALNLTIWSIFRALNFLSAVFRLLLSLLMSSPFYLVILAVIIVFSIFWDQTIKPLCEYIIIAINGIIDGYNGMVDFEVGFDMGDMGGYVRLFAFSDFLPRAQHVGADIPKFIPFVTDILVPTLFMPIKQKLTGIIFA